MQTLWSHSTASQEEEAACRGPMGALHRLYLVEKSHTLQVTVIYSKWRCFLMHAGMFKSTWRSTAASVMFIHMHHEKHFKEEKGSEDKSQIQEVDQRLSRDPRRGPDRRSVWRWLYMYIYDYMQSRSTLGHPVGPALSFTFTFIKLWIYFWEKKS